MKEHQKEETTEEELPSIEETAEEAIIEEPVDLAEEPTAEESEVAILTAQLSEMEDKFLRAQAEIANMRTRFQKERESLAKYRSQDLAKNLLPAVDNLERALQSEVSDEQGANLKKGIEMVLESLVHALKEAGIEEIPAVGTPFDPNLHQAVQTIPAEGEQKADEIIQVLQKGYKLHERVLRPTMVIVAQ